MGVLNYTSAQLNAMMVVLNGDSDSNVKIASGEFRIANATTGKFHPEWIEGSDGSPALKISLTGVA